MHDGDGLMQSYLPIFYKGDAYIEAHVWNIFRRFLLVDHLERDIEVIEKMDDRLASASKIEIVHSD